MIIKKKALITGASGGVGLGKIAGALAGGGVAFLAYTKIRNIMDKRMISLILYLSYSSCSLKY